MKKGLLIETFVLVSYFAQSVWQTFYCQASHTEIVLADGTFERVVGDNPDELKLLISGTSVSRLSGFLHRAVGLGETAHVTDVLVCSHEIEIASHHNLCHISRSVGFLREGVCGSLTSQLLCKDTPVSWDFQIFWQEN